MTKDEIINELTEIILMQEQELKKLQDKLNRVKQYLEVYEEFIANRKR